MGIRIRIRMVEANQVYGASVSLILTGPISGIINVTGAAVGRALMRAPTEMGGDLLERRKSLPDLMISAS